MIKYIHKIIPELILTLWKEKQEIKYWKQRKEVEGNFSNVHFTDFYTVHFGLDFDFYKEKRILDIGCGPRGSLEWADMTKERVGLDPLADDYFKLSGESHKMEYVSAPSENIPHKTNHFDVVTSFNSIDHVENINKTIDEIKRVLKPGGLFLLLTELNHDPTICEPQSITWDITKQFLPEFQIIDEKKYERTTDGIYDSIKLGVEYDPSDPSNRYGILSVKFQKTGC